VQVFSLLFSSVEDYKLRFPSESGPNWIHGTDDNPILDLAKQTNTLTMSWDGRQSVFDHLGNHLSEKEAATNTEIVWTIIEEAMKLSNEDNAAIPAGKSLYNFFEDKVLKLFPGTADNVNNEAAEKKRELMLQMAEMWGAFVGSPIQTQSLKFLWLEECIDGENLFVTETYHKVLQKIAKPALDKATVRFNHKVTKIVSHGETEEPSITVEIEGEPSQTFDEVVMTAPLGWLKKNMDAFVPELPERIRKGIEAIGYGHLDKVFTHHPISTASSTNEHLGLHQLPLCFLERISPIDRHSCPHYPQPRPPQRHSNNRPSSPIHFARRPLQLSRKSIALPRLHALDPTLLRTLHEP
jgi:hypothetical protein